VSRAATRYHRLVDDQEDERQRREWKADFEAAARRPLRMRLRYAFVHTHKPVLDDASFRAFETMAQYREWCAQDLPDWLGYGPAV
jgi:hypothetical protein